MSYLQVKLSFPASMLEAQEFLKLGIFSEEYTTLSSWCISLAAKLAVYGRMDLVADMATYTNRLMSPNTFGMPFTFFYIYLLLLLCLNPEMRRFA